MKTSSFKWVVLGVAMAILSSWTPITSAEVKGMAGVGGGGTGDLWTVRAEVFVLPSPWFAVMGGASYGSHTLESIAYDLSQVFIPPDIVLIVGTEMRTKTKISSFYADGLVGGYKPFLERGFVFLGAGLTVVKLNLESDSQTLDADLAVGPVFAAAVAVPFGSRVLGFFSLKQRYATTERKTEITVPVDLMDPNGPQQTFVFRNDISVGGLEMTVGIGLSF